MLRIKIAGFTVVAIFLALALRLINFEVINAKKFKGLSDKNCIRLIPQEGSRGRILDRQGRVIVGNELCYDVLLMPREAQDIEKVLTQVSPVLDISLEDLKDAFKSSFAASFAPVTIARNIETKKAIALEELKAVLDGVVIQPRPQRTYPYGNFASHLIGYLHEIDRWRLTRLKDFGYRTKDIVGFGGVEERYDYYLRQEEGGMSVEVDHRGRFVRLLGVRPARNGKDIQLTIDLKIQKIAEENLGERKGCVIVMDPYSGEIFAMTSHPNFNPAVFVKGYKSSIRSLFEHPEAPLINRATSGLYPAGSVFKLIVACAALQTGKINLSTTFFCPQAIYIGKQEFSCWSKHQGQNLLEAITHSCNVFFYRTGLLLGAQAIYEYALKFGFARPTAIGLPYEASGFVPSPLWRKIYRLRNWFDGDTVNLSIGQGELLVTPLQITRMMAVFANSGTLVTPYIVKAIDGRSPRTFGVGVYRKNTVLGLKENTLDYIRQGLRKVVSEPSGTANVLADLSVSVAGKTGTAQVPGSQSHGWFTGFFPFKNPKFVICVFLEHGGSGYYASALAKQIIESMVKEGLVP